MPLAFCAVQYSSWLLSIELVCTCIRNRVYFLPTTPMCCFSSPLSCDRPSHLSLLLCNGVYLWQLHISCSVRWQLYLSLSSTFDNFTSVSYQSWSLATSPLSLSHVGSFKRFLHTAGISQAGYIILLFHCRYTVNNVDRQSCFMTMHEEKMACNQL